MSRYYIDCRDYPSDINCTVALLADSKEELLQAVIEQGQKFMDMRTLLNLEKRSLIRLKKVRHPFNKLVFW